jgi:hypothetical protein
VVHAAYWKYAVRRIEGSARIVRLSRQQWFVRSGKEGKVGWKRDVALLVEENRLLRETVAGLPAKRLRELSARKKWTMAEQVMGVAFHDVYHCGQIQLLKRLQK